MVRYVIVEIRCEGLFGIRNHIVVISSVSCANFIVEQIAKTNTCGELRFPWKVRYPISYFTLLTAKLLIYSYLPRLSQYCCCYHPSFDKSSFLPFSIFNLLVYLLFPASFNSFSFFLFVFLLISPVPLSTFFLTSPLLEVV